MTFPGDELVPDPLVVIDRHYRFDVPPQELWPWVVQIGKGRAGWYLPRWVPLPRRGAQSIVPRFQSVSVGDEVADWGPGDPVFRAALVSPPSALVWHSVRDPAAGHRWTEVVGRDVLELSWALLLTPAGGGTDLHFRLRFHKERWRDDPLFRVKRPLFDLFDWLTIVGLIAGLRERLASAS